MNRILLAAPLAFLALWASPARAQGGPSTDASNAPAGMLNEDTRHTQVLFTIVRAGILDVHGRFDKTSGSLDFDPAAPEKSSVAMTVDTTSLNMMVPQLTAELVDKAAFDVADFPTATFQSTAVTRTGPTTGTVTGNLTLKGVTKPVTFDVAFGGSNGNLVAFHATATIKRSDFNMTGMRFTSVVSDAVRLTIEGQYQKPRPAAPVQ